MARLRWDVATLRKRSQLALAHGLQSNQTFGVIREYLERKKPWGSNRAAILHNDQIFIFDQFKVPGRCPILITIYPAPISQLARSIPNPIFSHAFA